ncbi:hypothetical protein ACFT5C_05970 [Streptomyces sp. NPDC057116]|uniref:hypothetical protein n=1 Tax=Streptomyces sp. NPDC057116 TaxID=3346023 RepID=UPI003634E16B
MRDAVWQVANHLGVVAGTPGELLTALLAGPRRTVRVPLPPDHDLVRTLRPLIDVVAEGTPTPPAATRADPAPDDRSGPAPDDLSGPAPDDRSGPAPVDLSGPAADDLSEPAPDDLSGPAPVDLSGPAPVDLSGPAPDDLADPATVCAADPLRLTRAYEADPDPHGGLRAAWLRAGQSLVRDQAPADRALVLLAALDDAADPRVGRALTALAASAPWSLQWTVRGGCTALTAAPDGRLVKREHRAPAVACLPDGTELALDERGRLHSGPAPATRLIHAVAATLAGHPATALAAMGDTVLTGDRMGTVHAFSLAGVDQAALHAGRVTALTATTTVAYSGGTDGTVRAWRPGRASGRAATVTSRPCPVVALHATARLLAVAWADGLAELHHLADGRTVPFRPGPRIRAVAVTDDGSLVVGMDDALVCLASDRSRGAATASP